MTKPTDDLQTLLIASVPNLRAFANSLCGDPTRADDLVHDTLVKAWTSRAGIDIPLGKAGATKRQNLTLGQGTSQHVLIAGRTGSGKSTLMHAMITNLALNYSPDQVDLYLIDFKKAFGVLSDDQKEVRLLVGAEGFSYEEAAEITGAAVGTVKSRVNRARVALTKALGLESGEDFTSNPEFMGLVRLGQSVVRG